MKSDLPKVLHPIAGKPMVGHVIDTARQLTERQLHLIVGHGADTVQQQLGDQHNYILQEQQLGTGHAVQQALPFIDDNSIVLILYGDVPLIAKDTVQKLIDQVNSHSMGLLTINLSNPTGYGRIVRATSGEVKAIVEQKDATEEQQNICEVNTGFMAVNSAHLEQWLPALSNNNAQGEYYLTDIIAMAQQEGIVINTVQPAAHWEVLGVNDRRQQAELERVYQTNLADALLKKGVTLRDPARFDCRGSITVGRDVIIDVNCIFKGDVVLGDGVTIGANSTIDNASIAAGSTIKENSMIQDSQLHEACTVGPYARLRPGTVLENGAKIGNFVEIKKAAIGAGSKVNHLSYVGDATLGRDVNIGAGTITCNYDGVNKHKTTIEDGVFVGSNSALVAPVTLEQRVTIGAGSTINKSVEKETLSLTRSPQKNIKNWKRPEKK